MTATTRGQRRTSDKHRYRAPHVTEHAMQACRKERAQG